MQGDCGRYGEGVVLQIARQSDANGAKSWSILLDTCWTSELVKPSETIVTRKGKGRGPVTEAKIERDIAIYKRRCRGLSIRAIGAEFGMHISLVEAAIKNGQKYAQERGIDVDLRQDPH